MATVELGEVTMGSVFVNMCSRCRFTWPEEDCFNNFHMAHDELYEFKNCPHCGTHFDEEDNRDE